MEDITLKIKEIASKMPTGKAGEDFEKQVKTVTSLLNLLKVIPELSAAVGKATTTTFKVGLMEFSGAPVNMSVTIGRIIDVLDQLSKGDEGGFLTRIMTSVKDIYGKLTKYHQGVPLTKVAEKVTKFFTDLKSMAESLSSLSDFGQSSDSSGKQGTGELLKAPDPTLEEKIKTSMTTLKDVLTKAIQPNVDGILFSLVTIENTIGSFKASKTVDKISEMVKSLSGLGGAFEELVGLGTTDPVTVLKKFGEINTSLGALAKAVAGDKAGSSSNFVGPPMPGVDLATLSTTLGDVDFTSLAKISTNVTRLTGHLSKIKSGFDSITGTINTEGLKSTMDAIIETVDKVNTLNDKLAGINAGKIKVDAGLKTLATGLGLGGENKIRIDNKAVVIDLTVQVSMHASEFEKALVCRADSFIRERVNAATSTPTVYDSLIPEKPPAGPVPKLVKAGA